MRICVFAWLGRERHVSLVLFVVKPFWLYIHTSFQYNFEHQSSKGLIHLGYPSQIPGPPANAREQSIPDLSNKMVCDRQQGLQPQPMSRQI